MLVERNVQEALELEKGGLQKAELVYVAQLFVRCHENTQAVSVLHRAGAEVTCGSGR